MRFLKVHKMLLAGLLTCLALLLLGYWLLLRPRIDELRGGYGEMVARENRLKKAKWPMDSDSLKAILEANKSRLSGKGGLQSASKEGLSLACSMLSTKLSERGFGSVSDFRSWVMNSLYQQDFSEMLTSFESQGVFVSPEVLKLSVSSKSRYNYQLLLQCWTVETLVGQALRSGLTFRTHDSIEATSLEGKRRPAALVTALPIRAYGIEQKKVVEPYLLEIPVRLGLSGSLESMKAFLSSLNERGKFFGVLGFEFIGLPPNDASGDEDGMLKAGELQLNIECASYLQVK
jgi:Tfp pilus assembly protein PilO